MKRRNFIYKFTSGIPAIGLLNSCHFKERSQSSLSGESEVMNKVKHAMYAMQRAPWEQGTAMHGLIETGEKTEVILMAKEAVLRQNDDGRLAMLGGSDTSTDPAVNGRGVLFAWQETGDPIFKKAAEKQYHYLKKIAPKNPNGILYHFIQGQQIWSDSMFMAPPFLMLMGDHQEALKQIEGYRNLLWNEEKRLFSHMWDDVRKEFRRSDFWGGGNGWCAAAFAQIIENLPENRESEKTKIAGYLKDLLDGCIRHMGPDGLFHDVVDNPDSFIETNLSQMLAYAIYKTVRNGYLDEMYLAKAAMMRDAAWSRVDQYGLVQDACSSPRFDRPGTSTEAQAFFLMMEGAYRKAFYL
ncbi:MAG TPA: glycoside hydrolase family 88 protein [Bacteroidales bacterium]|nr:glycoside hydrolase family 88 protein [Bacteroidales bacterium]